MNAARLLLLAGIIPGVFGDPSAGHRCNIKECGCGPDYLAPHCTNPRDDALIVANMQGPWCNENEGQCTACWGTWCPVEEAEAEAEEPHPPHTNVVKAIIGDGPTYKSETQSVHGKCSKTPDYTYANFVKGMDYVKVAFLSKLPNEEDSSTDAEFKRSNILGSAIRWAFHDCAEYRYGSVDNFGCDGCLSNTEPNSGLKEDHTLRATLLQPIWQEYCDLMSLADFVALIGAFAAEYGDRSHSLHIEKYFGRKDNHNCNNGAGRLPGHQAADIEIEKTFLMNMQMTMREVVAAMGGHTVGHVHKEFSGFGYGKDIEERMAEPATNAWSEHPGDFDNDYYHSLRDEPWINAHRGNDGTKNIWLVDEKPHEKTVMLNTDMALAFKISQKVNDVNSVAIGDIGEICAPDAVESSSGSGEYGCVESDGKIKKGWPTDYFGIDTYEQVGSYIDDNNKFLNDYAKYYEMMSTVGYTVNSAKLNKLDNTPYEANDGTQGNLQNVWSPKFWGDKPASHQHSSEEETAAVPAQKKTVLRH